MNPRAAGPILMLLAGLAACNDVTYDASATTTPRITTTTVYAPTGTTEELLASIATEVGGLSEQLVDDDGQRAALGRIEARWTVVRPRIETAKPELLAGFDAVLALVQRSVERRRPADADKAAKNLAVLIRSFEA